MKQTIIFLSILFTTAISFANPNMAGKDPTIEEVAKKKTEKLALALTLTKEQKDKVYNACVAYLTQRKDLMPTKEKDKTGFDAKMKAAAKTASDQVIAALTPAQLKKLEKLKAEAGDKYKEGLF